MARARLIWCAGVVVLVFALLAAIFVASVLPAGYDFHAYWLAGRHLMTGAPLYPDATTILGITDEFRYLPIVAMLFVPFALLPYEIALPLWTLLLVAIAAVVGFTLVRPLPVPWQPWAAAGYVFFLGLVLEVTLGNVNLISLALALAAWRVRDRAIPAGFFLAAAVGLKFLPITLLLFYVASGRWRAVIAGAAMGVAALVVAVVAMPDRTAEYLRFAPRLLEREWVYTQIARPGPPALAEIFWSESFRLALAAAAVLVAVVAGVAAHRDPARQSTWHALTIATAGYLAPFGYFWTTFLILSLPLAADTLRRAATGPRRERVLVVGAVFASWLLMQPQQTGTLVPILWHVLGVMLLCATAVLTLVRLSSAAISLQRTRAPDSALS